MIDTETSKNLILKYGKQEGNSGSTEVQVAIFTHRINHLTKHLKAHKKDYATRRGLLKLVGKRRRLLDYLKAKKIDSYRSLIKQLNLRR